MIWTTTPQSFIALGFLKLGYFIRFGSYSQSQDLVTFYRPGPSLKLLARFHYQKHLKKIQFKYDQILHDLDYHSTEFRSSRIFETWLFHTFCIIQSVTGSCWPGLSLKILAQFHYQNFFFLIQFKYDQILHDLDYHPTEFHSSRIFETWSFHTFRIIQSVPGSYHFLSTRFKS